MFTRLISGLTIKGKIYSLVVCILALMLITIGVTALKLKSLGTEITTIAEEDVPLTEAVTEITINQLEQAINFERALRYGEVMQSDATAEARFKHVLELFDALSEEINREIKTGEKIAQHAMTQAHGEAAIAEFRHVDEILKDVETRHSSYEQHAHQTFALLAQGNLHAAHEIAQQTEAEEEHLDHELESLLKEIEKFTEASAVQAKHDEQSALSSSLIGSLLAAFLGFAIALFITRNITRAIYQAVDVANKIANDDLTSEIEARSKDEVGQLLTSLGIMQSSLKERIEADRTQKVAIEEEIQGIVNASLAGDLGHSIDLSGKDGFFKMLSQGINWPSAHGNRPRKAVMS